MTARFLLVALLSPVALGSQVAFPPAAIQRSIAAHPTSHSITVDGRLDEAEWRDAVPATGFTQNEPHTGSPGTEATEVRVLFDADRLYIGAYLHDREPDRLIVNDLRKDFAEDQQDDFEVLLRSLNQVSV